MPVDLAQQVTGAPISSEAAPQRPGPEADQSHSPDSEPPKPEGNQASKPEGGAPEAASKAEAPDPKTITKDQITDIIRRSTDLNDLKLNLGLGPVTDEALGAYLMSKGFSPPGSMRQEPAPDYDGPAIGPDSHGTVTRNIYVTNSDGSTTKIQMTGSPEALDQVQRDVRTPESGRRW